MAVLLMYLNLNLHLHLNLKMEVAKRRQSSDSKWHVLLLLITAVKSFPPLARLEISLDTISLDNNLITIEGAMRVVEECGRRKKSSVGDKPVHEDDYCSIW
jgi:hypothetical protein